jgi:hypothetical protein
MEPKLRNLLKQGERATRLGKAQAAERVYRQALEAYPQSAEAWLGLSRVAPTEEERQAAFRQALELDPSLSAAPERSDGAGPAPAAFETASDRLDAALKESENWLQQATEEHAKVVQPAVASTTVKERSPDVEEPPASELTTCFYHPRRQTALQCNRCSKPICTSCARSTPVGYRCKDCIKEQQETFYSAVWYDTITAVVVTVPLAAIASAIIPSIGWLTIFIAPFAGTLIAEVVRLVTRRRRGRWLPIVVGVGIVLGSLPTLLSRLIGFSLYSLSIGSIVWQVAYLALAISFAYYRLK